MNTERKSKDNITSKMNHPQQTEQANKHASKGAKPEDIRQQDTPDSSNVSKKVQQKSNNTDASSIQVVSEADAENYFSPPPEVLYPRAKLRQLLEWKTKDTSSVGLINQGHTCFMDASLQCLFFTPPFCQFILQSDHINKCLHSFLLSIASYSFLFFRSKAVVLHAV